MEWCTTSAAERLETHVCLGFIIGMLFIIPHWVYWPIWGILKPLMSVRPSVRASVRSTSYLRDGLTDSFDILQLDSTHSWDGARLFRFWKKWKLAILWQFFWKFHAQIQDSTFMFGGSTHRWPVGFIGNFTAEWPTFQRWFLAFQILKRIKIGDFIVVFLIISCPDSR